MKFTKRIILVMLFFISAFMFTSLVKSTKVNAEGEVCEIVETGVKYATFADAWTASTSGQTIKLLADTNTGRTFNLTKNITFDFDDYTLTHDGNGPFMSINIGNTYTFTLKASGNGGVSTTKNLLSINENFESSTRINILSGTYNKFNIYCYNGSAGNLQDENFFAKAGLDGILNISGGEFHMGSDAARSNLLSFLPIESLKSSTTLPSGNSNRFILNVKPETYITDENTQTSLNLSYDRGYSYYRRVTSLSSSDAGKKYLLAYVNQTEDVIYIMRNIANVSYQVMTTDKHNNVNRTNDGTWYITSNSEFKGNPNEDYFVTLGWDSNGYTLSVKDGASNKFLFYNKTNGNQISPKDESYKTDTTNYEYKFGFNDANDYLYPLSTNACIAYTPNLTYANMFRVVPNGQVYESGIGDSHTVRAHLFEKVVVNPEVDEASIRFGKCITKDMYDYVTKMGTDVTFGVIAKKTSALGGAELTVANASMTREITPARVASPGAAVEDLEGNYYQFALVIDDIDAANFETSITARVYICVDGEYYYMNASEYSVKTLAAAYYNAVDTSAYTEHLDVLEYLKDYVG